MKLTKALRDRFGGIKLERAAIARGEPPGSFIPTRLREFDKRGGHKRKTPHLYAAESGGGKSLWKLHLAWAAATSGHSVTIVDLEDPLDRSADRMFARETGINSAKLLSGDISDKEVFRVGIALAEMEEWTDRVEIFDGVRSGAEALELFEENPADLELLDYLSAFPHGRHGREREISDFMWGWTKHLQQEDIAGVAFAQLKGDVGKRGLAAWEADRRRSPDAKPNMNQFRGYDADDIMWCSDAGRNAKETGFMQRPGRILERLGFRAEDNVMEFNFPKRNWGAEGLIRVGIDLRTARFTDLPERKSKDD